MSSALQQGLISEQTIKDALVVSRGDLFLACRYLKVRPRELDSYIRCSETLQGFAAAIEKVKTDPEYNKMSVDQFNDQLDKLTLAYKVEALDIIHELATMSYESAAMADVKLKAAVQLRGNQNDNKPGGDQSTILAELNQLYHQNAPRIKSVRVAQIEFQDGE